MTQTVRLKWVFFVAMANAALALIVCVAVARGLHGVAEAGEPLRADLHAQAEALRTDLRAQAEALRTQGDALRDLAAEVRASRAPQQSAGDPQLTQTLQLLASEQHTLLLRALQPEPAASKPQARRQTPRRRTTIRPGCAVPSR